MARLVVMNGHQKDTCYDEIGLCAQKVDNIKIEHNWEGICDQVKRKRIFTLTSCDFCTSTSIPILGMTIFMNSQNWEFG